MKHPTDLARAMPSACETGPGSYASNYQSRARGTRGINAVCCWPTELGRSGRWISTYANFMRSTAGLEPGLEQFIPNRSINRPCTARRTWSGSNASSKLSRCRTDRWLEILPTSHRDHLGSGSTRSRS